MGEGIVRDNNKTRRTEAMITPKLLKERFLFGVELVDNKGNQMPDKTLQDYIDIATSMLEHDLDINIVPVTFAGNPLEGGDAEEKDYQANDYWQWGYFQLNNLPVVEVLEVRAVYPNANILSYPKEWFKLQPHDGILRLIPSAGTLSQFAVDVGGQYFPEIFRSNGHVPLVWQIDYTAGFQDGKIPMDVNAAIGMIAGIMALNIAGDLIAGAGIATKSISLDGLSQSISTTSSATNAGYGARLIQYDKQIKSDLATLKNYYLGLQLVVA